MKTSTEEYIAAIKLANIEIAKADKTIAEAERLKTGLANLQDIALKAAAKELTKEEYLKVVDAYSG